MQNIKPDLLTHVGYIYFFSLSLSFLQMLDLIDYFYGLVVVGNR